MLPCDDLEESWKAMRRTFQTAKGSHFKEVIIYESPWVELHIVPKVYDAQASKT
jgi:hypothetical protein